MEHEAAMQWYENPESWVAIAFAIFVFLFVRYLLPVIGGALDTRAAKIRTQLEQAAKLKEEAQALLATYEKQKKEAQKQAKEILATAKRDADAIRAKANEELKLALERRTKQAEEKIARAEAEATQSIRAQLIDIATEAARQVITDQLKDQKDDPAITRALASIERQIH